MATQTLAVPAAATSVAASHQIVTVRIGKEIYGVPIDCVESIVRWEPLTRLPRLPRSMAGILNLRGKVVPVVDLRIRLELPADECGTDHRVVITRVGNLVVGWIVDAVREVIWVESSQIESNVPLITEGASGEVLDCLQGVANLPQGFVILLDLSRLLSRAEQNQLTKLESQA